MVVRSKLDVPIRMAELKVRNVATCAGRYAQVGRQDGEEGIVTLFTCGRCLSNRVSCWRERRKRMPWPHFLGSWRVAGEHVVMALRAQAFSVLLFFV